LETQQLLVGVLSYRRNNSTSKKVKARWYFYSNAAHDLGESKVMGFRIHE
jgi:hypothetical protein